MRDRSALLKRLRSRGFTYIGLLILIALIGVALTAAAELTSTALQRDREEQLLFAGSAYAAAIDSYRRNSPGAREFPQTLEVLVKDPRLPTVRRHIRRLYVDPITESLDWGIVRGPNNGIVGVYSKSEREPLKKANFSRRYQNLAGAKQYADWKFMARSLGEESGSESAAADDGRALSRPTGTRSMDSEAQSPFTTGP